MSCCLAQDDEAVAAVTTEKQREQFLTQLNDAEEWLYEDGEDAPASQHQCAFCPRVGSKLNTDSTIQTAMYSEEWLPKDAGRTLLQRSISVAQSASQEGVHLHPGCCLRHSVWLAELQVVNGGDPTQQS